MQRKPRRATLRREGFEGTLAEWLKNQTEAVPAQHAAALVGTLAQAVHHAHGRGIVHRDLKPANVMVSGTADHEQALITDFGISASATEAAGGIRSSEISSEELVQACLDRIGEREPIVRAWEFLDPELADTRWISWEVSVPTADLGNYQERSKQWTITRQASF